MNLIYVKEVEHKSIHTAQFHLYKVWKQANVRYWKSEEWFPFGKKEGIVIGRGQKCHIQFHALLVSHGVFALWLLIELYPYDLCTFLYPFYTSIEKQVF